MKPVYQKPLDGQCLRACIASLFEVPLESLPLFGADVPLGQEAEAGVKQNAELRAFLATYGLDAYASPQPDRWTGLVIASGPSPRGPWNHCCIYDLDDLDGNLNPALVHDPHPDGEGLPSITSYYVFVVRDPSRMRSRVGGIEVVV